MHLVRAINFIVVGVVCGIGEIPQSSKMVLSNVCIQVVLLLHCGVWHGLLCLIMNNQ